ncbi:unnamed protein product [Prorocentrum cordatum]|uniref:Uncharacterized protein n=1 Tax=Prorocentrum cordatum TaxID=2364126 RepID=A0ABN9QNP3_9DINO|nr:unnamed protein product [Polarella glacialis]
MRRRGRGKKERACPTRARLRVNWRGRAVAEKHCTRPCDAKHVACGGAQRRNEARRQLKLRKMGVGADSLPRKHPATEQERTTNGEATGGGGRGGGGGGGRSGRRGARGGERRDHRASSAAAEGRVGQPPSKERTAPPRKPRPLLGPAPTGGKAPSSSSAASAHGHPAPCGAARSEDLRLEAARVCAAQKLQRYSVTAELHDRRRKRSAARSAG